MTQPESSADLARTIADKLANAGGVPANVHAATGQIYAMLAVAERLDAVVSRLDRFEAERRQMLAESAGTSAGSSAAPLDGVSARHDSPTV